MNESWETTGVVVVCCLWTLTVSSTSTIPFENKYYNRYIAISISPLSFFQQKMDPMGRPTLSAHPARFSPDDKFSKQRVVLKKRFGLLPTQQPKEVCWRKTQWTDLTNYMKILDNCTQILDKGRLSWQHFWRFVIFVSSVYIVYSSNHYHHC